MPEYPGLSLSIQHNEWNSRTFPHGAEEQGVQGGTETELLYVRELAMMDLMEKLTDKPDWHKKIFNGEIVAKWREEALDEPDEKNNNWVVMNENAIDCCIKELQAKAKYFEKTGIVPTLEACAAVTKSDVLVGEELHAALRCAFDKLRADQQASPDWHPNSNDMVQDLVHPSMYPLVYGRTRAFQDECVGLEDAIKLWAGKGDVIPKESKVVEETRYGSENEVDHYSNDYQWLPANLAFQPNGSVKCTSYINNLHPTKYPEIYQTIEKLVEVALPMWDQCLGIRGSAGPRMPLVDDPSDDCTSNWTPSSHAACASISVDESDLRYYGWRPNEPIDPEDLLLYKWLVLREPALPEPIFRHVDYSPKPGSRLVDHYADSGLQIIVKMASIELTPSKPVFPQGSWHLEGQLNEHICGTALYYLDSENIEDNHLAFRMPTEWDIDDKYRVAQDQYSWMDAVFNTSLGGMVEPCIQNYGKVVTREGRLLAFPNTLQHQVSEFGLIDPTKPGHRRFIALWLVDPGRRIISTANVPPQQLSWYADNLLGEDNTARMEALDKLPTELVTILQERGAVSTHGSVHENARLPEELMDMVRGFVDADGLALPMGEEEAKEHRLKLMAERSTHAHESEKWWESRTYNFCEH